MILKLKEAREAAGHSIEHVAKKLNIRKQYLIALEEENYHEIPGKIYVEGYTKMYYELLGINLSTKQDGNSAQTKAATNGDNIEIENKYKKYIIFCSVILLALVIFFYRNLVSPHWLEIQDDNRITENITQPDAENDGNNEENLDGSYQTDQ